jgi:hypothetical protein
MLTYGKGDGARIEDDIWEKMCVSLYQLQYKDSSNIPVLASDALDYFLSASRLFRTKCGVTHNA